MVKERPARRRQLNSTRTTAEQFHSNLVFQITDLPAKRRLRRMQAAFGRNGQTTGLRDGHEVPQMSKLHTLPSILAMPRRHARQPTKSFYFLQDPTRLRIRQRRNGNDLFIATTWNLSRSMPLIYIGESP